MGHSIHCPPRQQLAAPCRPKLQPHRPPRPQPQFLLLQQPQEQELRSRLSHLLVQVQALEQALEQVLEQPLALVRLAHRLLGQQRSPFWGTQAPPQWQRRLQ